MVTDVLGRKGDRKKILKNLGLQDRDMAIDVQVQNVFKKNGLTDRGTVTGVTSDVVI